MNPDLIGWLATGILILTVGSQAFNQWQSGTTAGQSRWLFIGQTAASIGFVVYSFLLDNWVFVVSNCFLLVIAALGQWAYKRNEKREQERGRPSPA